MHKSKRKMAFDDVHNSQNELTLIPIVKEDNTCPICGHNTETCIGFRRAETTFDETNFHAVAAVTTAVMKTAIS